MAIPSATRAVPVQHAQAVHARAVAAPQPQAPLPNPYTPSTRELHAGPRNRFFLALRSGIDDEVDWALPRLVLASFDRPDSFLLEHWIDSVTALREWPDRWLDELEREVAYREVLRDRAADPKVRAALGAVPAFTRNPLVEQRAMYSLQILRNASFTQANAHLMARTNFVSFLLRFFALPLDMLLEITQRQPEPVQHVIIILQSLYSFLYSGAPVFKLLTDTLPRVVMGTRDLGVWTLILPLLITTFQVPTFPAPPEEFIQHLLYLLTLGPPTRLLELVLDLLCAIAPQPQYSRTILTDPSFPAHLKQLVLLLEHQARPTNATWEPPRQNRPRKVLNPASATALARQATYRRDKEREADQQKMEAFGGPGVFREVADKAPAISAVVKKELYQMSEPKRSIAWMHETFVYSSHAQLLQVTFWHAYRDFFSNSQTVEQLLSASEVIKNVTVAFPAAQAKYWTDESGERKFVIAGMGFRKGPGDSDRFNCAWRACDAPNGATNPGQLLDHIQKHHLGVPPQTCGWGSCHHTPFNLSHLLIHLPMATPPELPDALAVDQSTPPDAFAYGHITHRPAPLLPPSQQLMFKAKVTPHDAARNPTGVAFLSALVIRALARNLRSELAAAARTDGMTDEQRQAKKKHLAEDRFGLPIPASVLQEEEEEEAAARGMAEVGMTVPERERAKAAFEAVEGRVLEVVNTNFTGLGMYLGEAFGW